MRILQVISRLNVGGTSVWITNLNRALTETGNLNAVMSGIVDDNEMQAEVATTNISFLPFWGKKRNLIGDLRAIIYIRREIESDRVEVVNTHAFKGGLIGRIAALTVISNKPLVVHTVHGHLIYGYENKLKSLLWSLSEVVLSWFTDKIICVGTTVKDDLSKLPFLNPNKLTTILPTCETSPIERFEKRDSKAIVVGWMGRLEHVKDPELVLEIASLMPEIQFRISGFGSKRNSIINSAPPNVIFLDYCDPHEFWQSCDIALSTSRNEGVPTSVLEAMSLSLPIVAPAVGSIRDAVKHEFNGYLVKSRDPVEYSQVLGKVISNPELRQDMGEASNERLIRSFSFSEFKSRHLKTYGISS